MKESQCPVELSAQVCDELLKKLKARNTELSERVARIEIPEYEGSLEVDLSAEIAELNKLARKRIEIKL
jgi:hypothetical protein